MTRTIFSLEILNLGESNVLHYMPHGVTTVELKPIASDGDESGGFIYPRAKFTIDKFHAGYGDNSQDFLIVWGGGKEKGCEITNLDKGKRSFFQIIHIGDKPTTVPLTFLHNRFIAKPKTILLVPYEVENPSRTLLNLQDRTATMTFSGSRLPRYYCRWFPPRPNEGESIRYDDVKTLPDLKLKFTFERMRDTPHKNIGSDIQIYLQDSKIAEVLGDWKFSWVHSELFTVFGDSKYVALRVWLYWIHRDFPLFDFRSETAPPPDSDTKPVLDDTTRSVWDHISIESPDIERFDFVINTHDRRIEWVGTDFHYQEWWYNTRGLDPPLKAKIANDVGTFVEVLRRLKERFSSSNEQYNPFEKLRQKLGSGHISIKEDGETVPPIEEYLVSNISSNGKTTYRWQGLTRKHIPYIEGGIIIPELISSVVTL